jgi:hypothetical protein
MQRRGNDAWCECGGCKQRACIDPNQAASFNVPNQNHFYRANPIDRDDLEAGQH